MSTADTDDGRLYLLDPSRVVRDEGSGKWQTYLTPTADPNKYSLSISYTPPKFYIKQSTIDKEKQQ